MLKNRNSIPKGVKEKVLKEYKHRCAVCGGTDPQLHHIDEDPSNNDPHNLIPLCPNCHLRDQHNPTAGIDKGILTLFREYKDPIILSAQFYPIYRRFDFLYDLNDCEETKTIKGMMNELIGFIRVLEMGKFYAHQLDRLLRSPLKTLDKQLGEIEVKLHGKEAKYTGKRYDAIRKNIKKSESLIVELLKYQNWKIPENKN
jgi:hypothetical protein